MASRAICSVAGCDKPHLAQTYCERHYRRFKKHGDPEAGGTAQGELRRYIDTIVLPFAGDDCLIWPYGRDKDGYAQGGYPGIKSHRAYRAVCELVHGAPPSPKHHAAHSCGRGHEGCISPSHLSWKTPSENAEDTRAHGTMMMGSGHTNSKLTENDVRAIRKLFGRMTHENIAARYGVARATISLISSGATWGWLE